MSDNIHEHHRKRLREFYNKHGFTAMTPCQVLEFMLFYVIPRKDTYPIAQKLIEKFGTVSGVLDATVEELVTVDGVGPSSAVFLKMFRDAFGIYLAEKTNAENKFYSVKNVGKYLRGKFTGKKNEIAMLMCFDSEMNPVSCTELSEGNKDNTEISIKNVTEKAAKCNASFVVIAHNHPGATAIPSKEDINTTVAIADSLSKSGILLLDHLIFADEDYISFSQSNLLDG